VGWGRGSCRCSCIPFAKIRLESSASRLRNASTIANSCRVAALPRARFSPAAVGRARGGGGGASPRPSRSFYRRSALATEHRFREKRKVPGKARDRRRGAGGAGASSLFPFSFFLFPHIPGLAFLLFSAALELPPLISLANLSPGSCPA
jgi:hypothetical protein